MRVAINGAGVAGPTLAWWLARYGHRPVLFEKSPTLRTGGYLIDFWGVGYDVADRMGLLPALHEKGYLIESLRFFDGAGRVAGRMRVGVFRDVLKGRFISIARGDVAATIYRACGNIETRFGCSIDCIEQDSDRAEVRLTDGSVEQFDLVVGADGLHSRVRSMVFGPDAQFERHLGCHVAALTVEHYPLRDELTYAGHTLPNRMVARVSLRDDLTLFLFVFRSKLLPPDVDIEQPRELLRAVYGDMRWETPRILERLDEVDDIYFDRVSQIRMDRWSSGRVALIGDAGACVSLLAGEGTGLAMLEAYTLAGELQRAQGDVRAALHNYEAKLKRFLQKKQSAATRMVNFFAPSSQFRLWLRNRGPFAASIPWIAKWIVGSFAKDDFSLEDYAGSR